MPAPTRVVDEADAYLLFERLRWAGAPTACPHCGALGRCRFLRPANGSSRRTRTGAASARRVWKCGACRRQFSVLTGTVFAGTRIGLRTWIGVVSDVITGNAARASQVTGRRGVSAETARHMLARLDAAGLRPGRE